MQCAPSRGCTHIVLAIVPDEIDIALHDMPVVSDVPALREPGALMHVSIRVSVRQLFGISNGPGPAIWIRSPRQSQKEEILVEVRAPVREQDPAAVRGRRWIEMRPTV